MSGSKALNRLLRIRALEEEQRRAALESALGQVETLKRARDTAARRERQGRADVAASAVSGEVVDRQAGLVEIAAAQRRLRQLALHIASMEEQAIGRRQEFLEKRVERRQAEVLLEGVEALEEKEADRQNQRGVDDWYSARRHRQAGKSESQ